MNTYPNNKGQWLDANGIRVEVYQDGSWVVYTFAGQFRSISSADGQPEQDIEAAKVKAREAYLKLTHGKATT